MIDKQYLAGLLDGEGFVGITFPHKNNYIIPQVAIGLGRKEVNRELLKQIAQEYDGWYSVNCRNLPKVIWGNRKAKKLLKLIFPYVYIKKQNIIFIDKILRLVDEGNYENANIEINNLRQLSNPHRGRKYGLRFLDTNNKKKIKSSPLGIF